MAACTFVSDIGAHACPDDLCYGACDVGLPIDHRTMFGRDEAMDLCATYDHGRLGVLRSAPQKLSRGTAPATMPARLHAIRIAKTFLMQRGCLFLFVLPLPLLYLPSPLSLPPLLLLLLLRCQTCDTRWAWWEPAAKPPPVPFSKLGPDARSLRLPGCVCGLVVLRGNLVSKSYLEVRLRATR